MHIVGGQIFLRHALRFKAYPWKLACLVDDRLSLENRFSIGDHFLAVPPCCLDPWFSGRLRNRREIHVAADLLQPR